MVEYILHHRFVQFIQVHVLFAAHSISTYVRYVDDIFRILFVFISSFTTVTKKAFFYINSIHSETLMPYYSLLIFLSFAADIPFIPFLFSCFHFIFCSAKSGFPSSQTIFLDSACQCLRMKTGSLWSTSASKVMCWCFAARSVWCSGQTWQWQFLRQTATLAPASNA